MVVPDTFAYPIPDKEVPPPPPTTYINALGEVPEIVPPDIRKLLTLLIVVVPSVKDKPFIPNAELNIEPSAKIIASGIEKLPASEKNHL